MTCRISRFQDGGSFQLDPLFTTCRLRILRRIVTNQIRRYKQLALECSFFPTIFSSFNSCPNDHIHISYLSVLQLDDRIATTTLFVYITDVDDMDPVFNQSSYTYHVYENVCYVLRHQHEIIIRYKLNWSVGEMMDILGQFGIKTCYCRLLLSSCHLLETGAFSLICKKRSIFPHRCARKRQNYVLFLVISN